MVSHSWELEKLSMEIGSTYMGDDQCACAGGRSFKRQFSKREFPLLGEDKKEEADFIWLGREARARLPKVAT